MGKFFAALIILFTFIKLAPMCARLPNDLTAVSSASQTAVVISTAELVSPAAAPVAAAPVVAPAPAPIAAPVKVVPPAPKAVEGKGVIVIAYRLKKMFPISDGRGRVSVLLRNDSEQKAVDLRLTMNAVRQGAVTESDKTNIPFTVDAGTGAYRGLYATAGFLDAVLANPPEEGVELQWNLTYRLEGDAPDAKRCFSLRALPRTREPDGIVWNPLGSSTTCPK